MTRIKTFGPVDERSLAQLERCMAVGDADYGVLCADHHPGYSQPIGGAIAYEGYVSPSGVGFDIGCVARGETVLCADGASRPIEGARDPLCADAGGAVRPLAPFLGVVARGRRTTLTVTLGNRRSVTVTPDHQIRTELGWRRADELMEGDRVLCPVFMGWPYDDGCVEPALLRLAGYVNGDGHLATRGSRVCLYTSKDSDAADLMADMRVLGANPSRHRRVRPNGSIENAVYSNNRSVCDRLEALGCPVGRKVGQWRGSAQAILQMPAYARACYLSGFASAEMSTPRLTERRVANLAIKQPGIDAIEVVAGLLESLGFGVRLSRSDGENWVAQILGGEEGEHPLHRVGRFPSSPGQATGRRGGGGDRMGAVASLVLPNPCPSAGAPANGLRRPGSACRRRRRRRDRLDAGDRAALGVSAGRTAPCAELVPGGHGAWRVRLLRCGGRPARR